MEKREEEREEERKEDALICAMIILGPLGPLFSGSSP